MKRTGDDPRRHGRGACRRCRLIAITLALGTLSACGGGGSSDSATGPSSETDRVDIKLPKGYKVVNGKVVAPASKASPHVGAAGGAAPAPPPTPPSRSTTRRTRRRRCSARSGSSAPASTSSGWPFIGAPNQADPSSPTNDPAYIDSLSTCAARSNIVEALKASQSANDNLSPAEIELRNKGVPEVALVHDRPRVEDPEAGARQPGAALRVRRRRRLGRLRRLEHLGQARAARGIEGPPGKDLLSSEDLAQCAAKSQKATGQTG